MIKLGKALASIAIATSVLSACSSPTTGSNSTQNTDASTSKEVLTVTETTSEVTSTDTAPEANTEEAELIELVLELEPSLDVLEPSSTGTIWVEGTFVNTSPYPVLAYELVFKDKTTNEKHYLDTYDTVMPGETSSKFETFGRESGDPKDMEFLTLYVKLKDTEDTYLRVEYDYKLEEVEADQYDND